MTQDPSRQARVLMYTAYLEPEYSGAALQALTLARELRRRGHAVEFVTNRWGDLPEDAVVDGFRVRRLEPGHMRKHREFRLWFNLVRYVWTRRRDFDVLHSHGAYFTNAFIGPLARLLGMKSVIKASLAANDLEGLSRPGVGTWHRAMLRSIDACVAISTDLAAEFRAGRIAAHRVHLIPNGVDTTRYAPSDSMQARSLRADLGLPVQQQIVLYVGVVDERKRVAWLAEQWVSHDAFGTGALLAVVGPKGRDDADGKLYAHVAALAVRHPGRLLLRDYCPQVADYYRCADALVLPSTNEGLPNVVLEAMSCGLPCVVARTSGSRELIRDAVNGYTYAPDDTDGLGTAVRQCLSPRGAEMGARGRADAVARFSISAIADRYQQIYAQLLSRRRRVLYVENGIGYGGAVICLRHLVRNLDRRRFEPLVVTGLGDEKYQQIANESAWRHVPDKRVDVISLKRALGASRWPDTVPGLRWVANQVLSRVDDLCNFVPSFLQTLWIASRFRPDIIHVNNEPLCNRAAVLAGRLLRVPVVSHVRGDQQGSMLMQPFFQLPDYFIAVSRWVSESIGRIGVPEGKRTYVYDGIELQQLNVDADRMALRRRFGVGADRFVVGLVGLLIPWKGQRLFLDAVERLAAAMPDALFAIIGGTPEECAYFEAELRARAEQPQLKGRVLFTGHVSEMAQVYAALDVVVSASVSPEPLGTMIIEGMTMARPVVAPRHGGAVEMVQDGVTGLLFTPGDAGDLADKVHALARDRELRHRLGAAAREHALRTFDVQEHVRRVQEVYVDVLARA